ncbi:MAG: hypothetical protein GY838_16425 [bacterium]|nr:hypothetical protein [bacterium]
MMTAAPEPPYQAARFLAPGRPRPLARRLAIHNRVVQRVRRFLDEQGYNEIPVASVAPVATSCEAMDTSFTLDHFGALAFAGQGGQLALESMVAQGFPAVWCESEGLRREWKVDERHLTAFKLIEAERENLDLAGLCDLQEHLVKAVAADLGAELLGGRHVTRLDRMLTLEHPRVTYREALAILNDRGWSMPFGEDLHRDAEATLSRYFGHLPFFVTHLPAALKPFNLQGDPDDAEQCLSVEYILPYAGETMDGGVRETDAAAMAERLERSPALGQQLERAEIFGRQQAAARPLGEDGPGAEELAAGHRSAIRRAWREHLEPFGRRELPRSGFALGVARLLQYLQGLDSIKDAVVAPRDRTAFAGAAPPAAATSAEDAGSA